MENNPEIILIKKVMTGEAGAFNILINNYRGKLFGYLLKYCGDRATAEDLFQDTLIKAWNGFKKYKEENKFSSWLFAIAHNVALDFLRKNRKARFLISDNDIINLPDAANQENHFDAEEIKALITRVVNSLPERQKNVFLLRQHGELTFKEISKITKEPLNTVLSHMNYAVKKIKKFLRENNAI